MNELFPSAIMFGMTSEEFWEDDPILYWSYRTFYLKKIEQEQQIKVEFMKYEAWLNGNMSCLAHSVALNNAFSKQKHEYPEYEKVFTKKEKKKKINRNEINNQVQNEFNAWARL